MADPVYLARLFAAIGMAAVLGLCASVNEVSASAPAPTQTAAAQLLSR